MGFMVLKTTGLSSRFQRRNRFWKISDPEILIKTCQNWTRQTRPTKFWTFWSITQDPMHIFKTDFCVETVSSSRSFWIPWTHKGENFFFTQGVLSNFQRICGGSKTFPYLLYPRATFPSWPKRSGENLIFQPPLPYIHRCSRPRPWLDIHPFFL